MSTLEMRSSRTVSTTTPSPRGRRPCSSIRRPTGSRRRSTTSRTANAGSKVARRPLSSLLLFLLLALGAACATVPPQEPVGQDARRALALLADRSSEFTDLRALADIALKRGRERQRLRGVLLVKAPSSIRFEALSPFGPPLLLVAIHEGRVTAYNAVKNEAHVGPANAETVAKVLGLPLNPEDLVAALAGRVALPPDLRSAELLPPDDAGPSLSLVSFGGRQRVWLDLETGAVRQLEIFGSPFNALIKYRRDGAGVLTGFDLEAAQSYVTGSITYQNLVEGGGIDEERCTVAVREGPSPRAQRCGQGQPGAGGARAAERRLPRNRHGHASRGSFRSAGARGRGCLGAPHHRVRCSDGRDQSGAQSGVDSAGDGGVGPRHADHAGEADSRGRWPRRWID